MTSKESSSKKSNTLTFKVPSKDSFWRISAIVLAVLLVIVLINGNGSSGIGMTVSSEDVGQKVLEFANSQGAEAELLSVNDDGALYEVILSISNQEVPLYVTKDGESFMLAQSLIPLTSEGSAPSRDNVDATPVNVPKSDKPVVELFIWSYCPYGVQAQEPFAEVASLLENSADLRAVMYHDGHGAYETQQNKIQACIQKVDREKYWDYAKGFVKDIYPKCSESRTVGCDLGASTSLMESLGIDSVEVLSCVETEGAQLIEADLSRARSNGITASPTIMINGVVAKVARTAESFKGAICDSFNEAPGACSTTLDSTAGTASGNC
jgi:hypothetical protein